MWANLKINKKRILYTICFFVFCLIDQRIKTVSGLDGWGESFRDLTGVVMAVLILSHYTLDDFRRHRLPILVWSLICAIGGTMYLIWGQSQAWFLNDRVVIVAGVYLFGIVLIYTFCGIVLERRIPSLRRGFAVLWLLMMVCMVFSRSEYLWPSLYLVIFGCFYLTDYTSGEREDLFQGMLDGILLSFFLMQGWCFVFRPYDAVRYVGVYNNCNMNALYYLVVLAAVFARLVYVYRIDGSRWIRIYYWLGAGTVLGFLFMTISRTGWLTAAVLAFVTLLFLWSLKKNRNFFAEFFRNALKVTLCFLVAFPLVFCAARYLPPLFHHPVWFWGEWNEKKVHSWDKWDSEKFVDIDELLRAANGRLEKVLEAAFGKTEAEAEEKVRSSAPVGNVGSEISELQRQLYDEAYAAGFAIDPADRDNAILVRTSIYRYYIHLLNWSGHPGSEQGFQMLPGRRIGHAHNLYIQWGVDFGIPAMLLFAILIVWSVIRFGKDFRAGKQERPAGVLLLLLVPAVFGLLEYCWGTGSLTITLLFVAWRGMVRDEAE